MSDSLCELVSFVEDEKERGSFSIYVTLHSFESIFFEMGFSVDDLYLLFLLVVDIFAHIYACRIIISIDLWEENIHFSSSSVLSPLSIYMSSSQCTCTHNILPPQVMMLSTPSSPRPEPESTSRDVSSSISSRLSSMRSELEPTDSSTTLSN